MKVLVFAGSARIDSFNKKLAALVARELEKTDASVTFVDLRDYPMPIYDGDLESASGLPESARKLKALFLSHDALFIVSPEYNSSITPLLKNTIDWVSRPENSEPPLSAYKNKIAAIVSASTGALGGLRGLVHLRSILNNIGVLVIPQQLAVGNAADAFDEQGFLKNEKSAATLENIARALVQLGNKLKSE